MNVMKRILTALSFANVNSLGELRTLLHQVDQPSASDKVKSQYGSRSSIPESSSVSPRPRHAQGAL
jgi:hypothetical protein